MRKRKIPLRRLPVFAAAGLVLGLGSVAFGAELTNPLTADQVACDELQLEHLATRLAVTDDFTAPIAPAGNPSLLVWRSSSGGGVYGGLAVSDSLRRNSAGQRTRNETQLALDLVGRQIGEPLNPHRPLLPQATMARRSLDSNLVTAGSGVDFLTVNAELSPQVTNPFVPADPLRINNLLFSSAQQPALATSDGFGRGVAVDNLAAACHQEFTAFDEKIFGILARMLRISRCLSATGCNPTNDSFNVMLFRGIGLHEYRANVYLYTLDCPDVGPCQYLQYSRVALELTINWDQNGKLTTGQIDVLPNCVSGQTSGCSDYNIAEIAVYILPPLWSGHEQQGEAIFATAPHLDVEAPGDAHNILSATINWQVLLANSTWN